MKAQVNFDSLGGGKRVHEVKGTPSSARFECGFEPSIIMSFDSLYAGAYCLSIYYDASLSKTTFKQQYQGSSSTPNVDSAQQLYNIDSTGFNLPYYNNYSSGAYIVAIE